MIFIVCFFSQYEYVANMSDFRWENQFSYGHHCHVKTKTTYIFAESKFESHENKISFDILYFWVKEKLFYKQCRLVRIISKVAELLYPEGGTHNFISRLHRKWESCWVHISLWFCKYVGTSIYMLMGWIWNHVVAKWSPNLITFIRA